jgi:AraC-like DNA-binding protein
MTLSQFRNRVRVAIALERLADGHENLANLSADLGFVDQSHLSRVVRANTGERLSALRYRLGDRQNDLGWRRPLKEGRGRADPVAERARR